MFCENKIRIKEYGEKSLILLPQWLINLGRMDMKEILNVKYEAKIPCESRPDIEHAWLEGQLSGSDVWVIHICEFKNGIYSTDATYLRPSELERLQQTIEELKRE